MTTYTQGYNKATLQSHQSRTAAAQADYLIPHIKSTDKILDVGCGPGTITCDFASLVPQGSVIGVDFSEQVLEQAQAEATQRNITNISFQPSSVHNLPFQDDTFDIVHCHALLIHVPDAAAAIKEMRRVLKPGGVLAIREPDRDMTAIHPHYSALDKWNKLSSQLIRNQGAEPNAGRHLAEWAIGAGFAADKVQVTCNVLQYTNHDGGARWWGLLYVDRVKAEFGPRALKDGLASEEEVEEVREAYRQWAQEPAAIWVMLHMRLLAWK